MLAHCVRTYCLIRLLAYVMLDFAGVRLGGLLIHAERHQKSRQRLVTVEHLRRNAHAAFGERYKAVLIHGNVAALLQPLCGVGDARLRDAELLGHIYRPDIAVLFLHHQHGLEIVLRRP